MRLHCSWRRRITTILALFVLHGIVRLPLRPKELSSYISRVEPLQAGLPEILKLAALMRLQRAASTYISKFVDVPIYISTPVLVCRESSIAGRIGLFEVIDLDKTFWVHNIRWAGRWLSIGRWKISENLDATDDVETDSTKHKYTVQWPTVRQLQAHM